MTTSGMKIYGRFAVPIIVVSTIVIFAVLIFASSKGVVWTFPSAVVIVALWIFGTITLGIYRWVKNEDTDGF